MYKRATKMWGHKDNKASNLNWPQPHGYTQALIRAIPAIGGRPEARPVLSGEPRSPIDPDPNTCRFFGRCATQTERCQNELPLLRMLAPGHAVACHFAAPPQLP